MSNTIVDQQDNLDALLVSAIGLADTGTDVLSENKQPLEDVVHLLAPTLDLTKRYGPAITCGLQGLLPLAEGARHRGSRRHAAGVVLPRPRTLPLPDEPAEGGGNGWPCAPGCPPCPSNPVRPTW